MNKKEIIKNEITLVEYNFIHPKLEIKLVESEIQSNSVTLFQFRYLTFGKIKIKVLAFIKTLNRGCVYDISEKKLIFSRKCRIYELLAIRPFFFFLFIPVGGLPELIFEMASKEKNLIIMTLTPNVASFLEVPLSTLSTLGML